LVQNSIKTSGDLLGSSAPVPIGPNLLYVDDSGNMSSSSKLTDRVSVLEKLLTVHDTRINANKTLLASTTSMMHGNRIGRLQLQTDVATNYVSYGSKMRMNNAYGNLTTCTRGACSGVIAMAGGSNNDAIDSKYWTVHKS